MKNNTRILWIVIVLLAVLNIATITTIIIHNINEKNKIENIIIEPDSPPLNGKFFRQQLNFDNEQMKVFRASNHAFRQQASGIVLSIKKTKELMYQELQSQQPDSVKLKEFSQSIGTQHAELKEATVKFYLALNDICNAEQKQQLKSLFRPLFSETPLQNNCGEPCQGSGGQGHRHGQENSNNEDN